MNKFKIGDEVIICNGLYTYTKKGSIGVIIKKEGAFYDVQFSKFTGDQPLFGYVFPIEEKNIKLYNTVTLMLKILKIS